MLTTTLDAAKDIFVGCTMWSPRDGGRTKATKLEDFKMDVMFKMIPTYIIEVEKVDISVMKNKSLCLSFRNGECFAIGFFLKKI